MAADYDPIGWDKALRRVMGPGPNVTEDYNPFWPDAFEDDREPDPDDIQFHIERAQRLRWRG